MIETLADQLGAGQQYVRGVLRQLRQGLDDRLAFLCLHAAVQHEARVLDIRQLRVQQVKVFCPFGQQQHLPPVFQGVGRVGDDACVSIAVLGQQPDDLLNASVRRNGRRRKMPDPDPQLIRDVCRALGDMPNGAGLHEDDRMVPVAANGG